MRKHILPKALFFCLLMTISGGPVNQSRAQEAGTAAVVLDFTSNDEWNIPTSNVVSGTFTNAAGYSVTFTGTGASSTGLHYSSGNNCIIFGKAKSKLALPVMDFDVERIVVEGGESGASTSVEQNIYAAETEDQVTTYVPVSSATNGAVGAHTYEIDSDYRNAGTQYVLEVTSAANTQVSRILFYAASASPVHRPEITPSGGTFYEEQFVKISAGEGLTVMYAVNDGQENVYTEPFPISSTGTYTVSARAVDEAGNSSSTTSVTFGIVIPEGLESFENGDFEHWDEEGNPAGWVATTGATSAGRISKSEGGHGGAFCARLDHNDSKPNLRLATKEFLLPAGKYNVDFWAKAADEGGEAQISAGYAVWDKEKHAIDSNNYKYGATTVVEDSWQNVTYSFELAEETQVNLVVMNHYGTGHGPVLVDDYSVTSDTGGEKTVNPVLLPGGFLSEGFDVWTDDGSPEGWISATNASNGTFSKAPGMEEGSYAVKIGYSESSNYRLASTEYILPPATYEVRFHARAAAEGGRAEVRSGYAVITDGKINGSGAYKYKSTTDVNSDEWTEIAHTFTLRETTTVNLVIMNRAGSDAEGNPFGEVLIDDYSIKPVRSNLTVAFDEGYATYYTTVPFTMPEGLRGTEVEKVDEDNPDRLVMNWRYVPGTIVPAGTALLVEGLPGTYEFDTALTEDGSAAADNLLLGSVTDTVTTGPGGQQTGYVFYKLSHNLSGEKAGFYWGAGDGAAFESAACRAWLAIPAATSQNVKAFVLGNDGETTAMESVASAAAGTDAVYDLRGLRVRDMSKKGVYITGGRKVVVR